MTSARRILVVDDDELLARTIADILAFKGFVVETALSGQDALTLVGKDSYNCVLMDIRMPGLNGIETHLKLKEIAPQTPVVLMTAYSDEDLISEAKANGVQAVLSKPLDIDFVVSVLARCATTSGAQK